MSFEAFISQDNNSLYLILINIFKNIIFQSLLNDRQFLISKSKNQKLTPKMGFNHNLSVADLRSLGLVSEIKQQKTKLQRNRNDQPSDMPKFWLATVSTCFAYKMPSKAAFNKQF